MNESRHSVFQTAFGPQDRQAMADEDAHAWAIVTGILFAIVTGGAILGIVGVLLAI